MFRICWSAFLRQLNINRCFYGIPLKWDSKQQILVIIDDKCYTRVFDFFSAVGLLYLAVSLIGLQNLFREIEMFQMIMSMFFLFLFSASAICRMNYVTSNSLKKTVALFNVMIHHEKQYLGIFNKNYFSQFIYLGVN